MKQDGVHVVSLPVFIVMHELLHVVGDSGNMEILACVAEEGMVPPDKSQPALLGTSVQMLVRHHHSTGCISRHFFLFFQTIVLLESVFILRAQ